MSMESKLEILDLQVTVDGNPILRGCRLTVKPGEVHALMGPNGSGKSTLAHTLMGHPRYEVVSGDVLVDGQSILELEPDERARQGLFMAFQYPVAIPGVSLANFMRQSYRAIHESENGAGPDQPAGRGQVDKKAEMKSLMAFRKRLKEKLALLDLPETFAQRYVNDGLSGGEKKRAEILQLAVLEPRYAVLDETDSGLDIDAIRAVAEGVNAMRGPEVGFLIITHYKRILDYVRPDVVHVMLTGRVVEEGGPELADDLEAKGYDWLRGKREALEEA